MKLKIVFASLLALSCLSAFGVGCEINASQGDTDLEPQYVYSSFHGKVAGFDVHVTVVDQRSASVYVLDNKCRYTQESVGRNHTTTMSCEDRSIRVSCF